MILPININPSVISYAHHAYPLAIIEGDCTQNLVSFQLNIKSKLFNEEIENDVKIEKSGYTMELWDKKYAKNTECFSLKECEKYEELVLELLEYRQDVMGGVLNLIIVKEDYLEAAHQNQDIYRMGMLLGVDLICSENGVYCPIPLSLEERRLCKKIKLSRNQNRIIYWAMKQEEWIEIYSIELPRHLRGNKLYIGINANMGVIQYYDWKYMNYMQLTYSEEDKFVWLDYFMYPRKNYSYNHAQQFIDSTYIPLQECYELFGSLSNGVLWYLKHGYYIELSLDEFYINGRNATGKKHFFHNNLIYGCSKDENIIYALGYKDKIWVANIEKEIIDKSIKSDSIIKLLKYKSNVKNLTFNLKRFMEVLKEFIGGKSSAESFCNILSTDKYIYGLKVFDFILNNEKARYAIQHDRRIGFLLYEHTQIMLERLDFFRHRGVISAVQYEELNDKCCKMFFLVERLKNLVLKNTIKEVYNEKILNCLKEVYLKEKEFCIYLLDILKKNS